MGLFTMKMMKVLMKMYKRWGKKMKKWKQKLGVNDSLLDQIVEQEDEEYEWGVYE